MKLISQLQNLFQNEKIEVDKANNSIVVKNIDHSLVYINPLDQDDLEQLRKNVQADQLELFDQLIKELVLALNQASSPKIKHFFKIEELKTATDYHRFLFENKLTCFTPEEVNSHEAIINYLEESRVALLLGYPATGKSIAVVEIAERLAIRGYKTYYFSFKKNQHWPEIWAELNNHADAKTVFVLDDVHLQPEEAGAVFNRVQHHENWNVLFISREVFKNRNFTDSINIYKALSETKVRTEQPSIDEKVKGIVRLYQAYYQREHQGTYPIGDVDQIIKKAHRNLIVLRAYLKLWEKFPDLTLGELQEAELYKDIYATYFEQSQLDEDARVPLLQYLCIYYFEIEFYRNPSEKESTKLLIDQAAIIKEENGLHSIYHGEYAFLLLKAFRFVHKRRFNRIGNNWQDFFFLQIKSYLLGFEADPNDGYPENLLELLIAIPRFTKEVQSGVQDTQMVFKRLVEDADLQPLIIECCQEEEEEETIVYFLASVIRYLPDQFKLYVKAFGQKAFDHKSAVGIYVDAFKIFQQRNQLDWLADFCEPYFSIIFERCSLNNLGQALNIFNREYPKEAYRLYHQVANPIIVLKCRKAKINDIGNALNELKNIDPAKTKAIYDAIDDALFREMTEKAKIGEVGKALNELKNIDPAKTKGIFDEIDDAVFVRKIEKASLSDVGKSMSELKKINPTKAKKVFDLVELELLKEMIKKARIQDVGRALHELTRLAPRKIKEVYLATEVALFNRKIETARINEVGYALNELRYVDLAKTKAIYDEIDLTLVKGMIEKARFHDVGNALNELKNIDLVKTQAIYDEIDLALVKEMIEKARINEIGNALNELKNIDPSKTKAIYDAIDDAFLKDLLEKARIHDVGSALNELKNINPTKTKAIYISIDQELFKAMIGKARINQVGNALNELKNIDLAKTKEIYESIDGALFQKMIEKARVHEVGNALNDLKNINASKTKSIYASIDKDLFQKMIDKARIQDVGRALNELKNIDPTKTKEIYASIDLALFEKMIEKARIQDVGKALNELKNIDAAKTKHIFKAIDQDLFQKMIEKARIQDVGKSLKELNGIDAVKTKEIYEAVDEQLLKRMIEKSSFQHIGYALNELVTIDASKTELICTNSKAAILKEVQHSKVPYSVFITQVKLLSKVSTDIGKAIYESIPGERIYQVKSLGNIFDFNSFAQYLLNIDLDREHPHFRAIVALGRNQSYRYLKFDDIRVLGVFIGVMGLLKQNLTPQLKKHIKRYTAFILEADRQKNVPRFISTIYMHSSNLAIGDLLKSYREAYPDHQEVVASTYIEIANNQLTIGQKEKAKNNLKIAKKLLKEKEVPALRDKIQELSTAFGLDHYL